MKNLINRDDPVYILFGWEAKEARPNCDPFTGSLRIHTDTCQVWTTGVHLKHHIRRVLEVPGETYMKGKAHFATFYSKYDDEGNPVSFNKRLDKIAEVFGFKKQDGRAAVDYCLDLPLFGFVNAYKNPKASKAKDTQKSEAEVETFNLCNAANTLFDPVTFHSCEIKYIGTNNAFPTEDTSGQVNTSAGSSTRDRLEYGLFLGLIEVNLPTLASNTRHHKFLPWSDNNVAKWIDVLASAQWAAYTTHRFSSQTQRNQFAKLQVIWQPKQSEISEFVYPKDLIELLKTNKLVTSWPEAKKALNATILPYLLNSYKLTQDNILGGTLAKGIELPVEHDLPHV